MSLLLVFRCLYCFRSYIAHFNYSLQRYILFVCQSCRYKCHSWITIVSTHRRHHVISETGFKQFSPNPNLLIGCTLFWIQIRIHYVSESGFFNWISPKTKTCDLWGEQSSNRAIYQWSRGCQFRLFLINSTLPSRILILRFTPVHCHQHSRQSY